MIVVRLHEGLGNQLFQYAMGRAVADRYGVPLKLDISWFATDQRRPGQPVPHRRFLLDRFEIEAPIATSRELAFYRYRAGLMHRTLDKALRLGSRPLAAEVRQGNRPFHPEILDTGPHAYLNGYWQSEKYFAAVADRIRREFRMRPGEDVNAAQAQLQQWRQAWPNSPLVALHVRRGELVPSLVSGKMRRHSIPPTSAAYLQEAIALFPRNSRFVIVCDPRDRDWAREHLQGENTVLYQGPSDLADFALLRGCDHVVIANSTFSWWAAWLNPNPGKQVVAPSPWFWPDSPHAKPNGDLVPPEWTVLKNPELT